jgi:hypothetical protein
MARVFYFISALVFPVLLFSQKKAPVHNVKISFVHTVNHVPLLLDSVTYTNPFAENYTVSKFKYYISNFFLVADKKNIVVKESYYLVDEKDTLTKSILLKVPAGNYDSLSFLLGVDSLKNVSGAQTGALDPTNDMFWTWNTGYVMAKLEGNSPASTVVNNKVEYHIGGFAGADNVLKKITLPLTVNINKDTVTEIIIEADINNWWQMPNDILIAANAVCTNPGALAKKIAANYSKMFSVKKISTPAN